MDGLKPGRIVYLVLSAEMAVEINRRRTTGDSIRQRMDAVPAWPEGAQAHIGSRVEPGDVVPAMVVKVHSDKEEGVINCKANLDGTDQYWAQNVRHDPSGRPGTWAWMFDGQATRHEPKTAEPATV